VKVSGLRWGRHAVKDYTVGVYAADKVTIKDKSGSTSNDMSVRFADGGSFHLKDSNKNQRSTRDRDSRDNDRDDDEERDDDRDSDRDDTRRNKKKTRRIRRSRDDDDDEEEDDARDKRRPIRRRDRDSDRDSDREDDREEDREDDDDGEKKTRKRVRRSRRSLQNKDDGETYDREERRKQRRERRRRGRGKSNFGVDIESFRPLEDEEYSDDDGDYEQDEEDYEEDYEDDYELEFEEFDDELFGEAGDDDDDAQVDGVGGDKWRRRVFDTDWGVRRFPEPEWWENGTNSERRYNRREGNNRRTRDPIYAEVDSEELEDELDEVDILTKSEKLA